MVEIRDTDSRSIMKTPLDNIAFLLASVGAPGSFATRFTMPADDLSIHVDGVGPVRLPVTPAMARKLCAVAQPARHGFKDQTRLDPRVRDTWEVARERIVIDAKRWQHALVRALERIRSELGLPRDSSLEVELHNLLVYARGQFFAAHQDSEKTDDMVGTLVVGLPSSFAGGEFVVEQHGRTLRAPGSASELEFVAFYADCHHQVNPVRSGHRIVLTWNLMLRRDARPAVPPPEPPKVLAIAVRDYFAQPLAPRWERDVGREAPDRLVYLLDHQYTRRGLAWDRLKNADAVRALALRAVAQQLNCEIFLAQADVHESWSCEDDYDASDWDEDRDDEVDGDETEEGEDAFAGAGGDPELHDLIESEIELRHWVGVDGGAPAGVAAIPDVGEVCFTRPSADCAPFASEHEGYMGNWGNTVDRWYHRAAVVLWPRDRAFVMRAKIDPEWALAEIDACLNTERPQALAKARQLLPFWSRVAAREAAVGAFPAALRVGARLADADLAGALLAPFWLGRTTPATLPLLRDLLDAYGAAWGRALLQGWAGEHRREETPQVQREWIATLLPAVCRLLSEGEGRTLADWLLDNRWAWLREHAQSLLRQTNAKHVAETLTQLCRPLLAIVETSVIAGRVDVHSQLLGDLAPGAGRLPAELALGLLHAAHSDRGKTDPANLGLNALHARCVQWRESQLSTPARADGDWSIRTPTGCTCELCATLSAFLRAPGEVRRDWPLAEAGRQHVHRILDARDLPVHHATRRVGRPYTLELEKSHQLFERDAAERRGWEKELAWLKLTSNEFSPPGSTTA